MRIRGKFTMIESSYTNWKRFKNNPIRKLIIQIFRRLTKTVRMMQNSLLLQGNYICQYGWMKISYNGSSNLEVAIKHALMQFYDPMFKMSQGKKNHLLIVRDLGGLLNFYSNLRYHDHSRL